MKEPLSISRREYKVMLNHQMFLDRKLGIETFSRELRSLARRLRQIEYDGKFKSEEKRDISFLDTSDHVIYQNGLILRQRGSTGNGKPEYTLKRRSADRYVAASARVDATNSFRGKPKFEEDIGPPFVSRFARSNSVKSAKPPKTLGEAAKMFPILDELERDGETCPGKLTLFVVNSVSPLERVITGPTLVFGKTQAELALIFWADGSDSRPLVAELSFRYKEKDENFTAKTASLAMEFFHELQLLDWCAPRARTKTQYTYRSDSSRAS